MKYTDEQQKVIDVRNKNVLVSAAAGSGKTAVLVERIIRMVIGDNLDIDRILVVTFTEAAAGEMRDRIAKAINDALEKDPLNAHLEKQSALLYKAQISTIHAFCLNIIRNNFNKIGLDPAYRIADEMELTLLREDVLSDLFERKYEEGDKEFLDCVDYFSKGVSDSGLRDIIFKLSDTAAGNPWPGDWLKECAKTYKITDVSKYNETPIIKFFMEYAKRRLEDGKALAQRALETAKAPYGPSQYIPNIEEDISIFEDALSIEDFDTLREFVYDPGFPRLSSKKNPEEDESVKEKCKKLREEYKDILTGKKASSLKSIMASSLEDELKDYGNISGIVHKLIALTLEYMDSFSEEKRKKGILGFDDMEHYAIDILYDRNEDPTVNERYVPSDVALEMRKAYDEILMDEYQDCNKVQELLISAISSETEGKYNRFMVGDVKQSIYKFRLASPELFIEKYERYKSDDQDGQNDQNYCRIDLHKNFRSRESVVNTTNDLFSQIMKKSLGNVEYDEDARLVFGGNFPGGEGIKTEELSSECSSEILMMELDSDSYSDRYTEEARLIAKRIKELKGYQMIYDKKDEEVRPASFRDMVILVRSATGIGQALRDVFSKEGIPFYMPMKEGFYETTEVQQVLQLLKVIDNPLQDIALYGTMKSFFGGFSDEEIASLRLIKHDEKVRPYLYEQLKEYSENNERAASFLAFLDELRYESTYMPVHELLRKIIRDTYYREYLSAEPGGAQKRANIDLLIMKAESYEKTSFKGLFHFVRYIKNIKALKVSEGEADLLSENADVVRIMTMHKSKGLEFPICFIAGIEKEFNTMDEKGMAVLDMDAGLGVDYADAALRIKRPTLIKKLVALKIKMDMLGEELRVLYVAMTRAREKLIITGATKYDEKKPSFRERALEYHREYGDDPIPYAVLSESKCYLDFLMPLMHKALIYKKEDITSFEDFEAIKGIGRLGRLEKLDLLDAPDVDITEDYVNIKERLERKYIHDNLKGLILKTSVSELKKKYMDLNETAEFFTVEEVERFTSWEEVEGFTAGEEESPTAEVQSEEIGTLSIKAEAQPTKPEAQPTKPEAQLTKPENQSTKPGVAPTKTGEHSISGTERGSAYHKVMELLDFTNQDVRSQLDRFVKEHLISKEWADAVPIYKIEKFMKSDLSKRMAKAQSKGLLKREQPFVLGIAANRVREEYPKDEIILLQGIIDAFFIEDGEIVLLDYKTDVIDSGEALMKRYKVQLDYYEEALSRILMMPVKERMLYSFCLGKEVS